MCEKNCTVVFNIVFGAYAETTRKTHRQNRRLVECCSRVNINTRSSTAVAAAAVAAAAAAVRMT